MILEAGTTAASLEEPRYRVAVARYPLLARALENARPTLRPKIEWLYDDPETGETKHDFNYVQFFRYARSVSGDAMAGADELFEQLCADVENVLWNGRRSYTPARRTCGGARELLGRNPRPEDWIALRPLAGPASWVTAVGNEVIVELVAELSLEAIRKS